MHFVRELWCHEVEGDAFRGLVVESDRVLVSTGRQTLVVSRAGDILGRHEPPLAPDGRPVLAGGECRYELREGELLGLDARGARISGAPVANDPFEQHRERILGFFSNRTDATREWTDDKIRRWWRSADLVADPARQRLLAVGLVPPSWLVAIQPDGRVDWALVTGSMSTCCNSVGVVARDGTLAHFSSCGCRITFVTADGQIGSAYDIQPTPIHLATDGNGVAYVTLAGEGVAAYRPGVGLAGTYGIPHVRQAGVSGGILYAVIEDPPDLFRLQAFEEPT